MVLQEEGRCPCRTSRDIVAEERYRLRGASTNKTVVSKEENCQRDAVRRGVNKEAQMNPSLWSSTGAFVGMSQGAAIGGRVPFSLYQRKVPFVEFASQGVPSEEGNWVVSCVKNLILSLNHAEDLPISARVNQCLRISQRAPDNLQAAYFLSLLGCRLLALGLLDEAERSHRRAFSIASTKLGAGHLELSFSLDWQGQALFLQGNYKEALLVCYAAKDIVVMQMGGQHPNVGGCLMNLAAIYDAMGWFLCAMQMREEAAALYGSILIGEDVGTSED
ncbi:hypothetical protein BSKO_07572 [Bryopsis sp. KO-2023]|nr:hypothetical protein BSKO_07572 [Bryopsis sp. KO-2023]